MTLSLCLGLLTGCESVSGFVDEMAASFDALASGDSGQAQAPSAPAGGSAQASVPQGAGAQPAALDLPPAPLPRYSPGDTFTYREAGQQIREQVLTTTSDKVVWTNESGTVWTTLYDVTSPVLSWSGDPELGRGKQEIDGSGPNLFPLAVGRETDFIVRGQSENRPGGWRVQHSCKVVDARALEVEAGRFFTYEIVCQRPDHIETIYYAPEAQTYARRIRAFDTITVTRDLVDFSLARERPVAEMSPFQTALATLDGEPMPAPVMKEEPKEEMAAPEGLQTLERRVAVLERKVDQLLETMTSGTAPAAAGKPAEDGKQMTGGMAQDAKFGLHLASYRTEAAAERGWKMLAEKYKTELGDLDHRLSKFRPRTGGREFVRLVAGGYATKAAADQACRPLRTKRQYCQAIGL
ncbi:MAG: SPOR domain-containing protein [Alphaproteobacteria bacterium]|nr:SPOR domain-containing protein [Alphaproteobacteria bacterium]